MKRVLKSGLLTIGAVLFLASCEKDVEADPNLNYRDEFLGVWTALENGETNGAQSYDVNISAGSAEDEIIFHGLYNVSLVKVSAYTSGYIISIPEQTSDGITFSGSGKAQFNFEYIDLTFTANDGTGTDNVKVRLEK